MVHTRLDHCRISDLILAAARYWRSCATVSSAHLAISNRSLAVGAVHIQGLVIPICIFLSAAVLYDRLRHLLFIAPAMSMLAGAGLYYCALAVRAKRIWIRVTFATLAPAMLLINFVSTALWYPYQYAYLNAFGRSFPQFAFDTDYLGLTMQEGILRMGKLGIRSFRVGPAPTMALYNTPEFGFALDWVCAAYPAYPRPILGGGAYYIHSRPSWGAAGLPSFCQTLFQIRRQGAQVPWNCESILLKPVAATAYVQMRRTARPVGANSTSVLIDEAKQDRAERRDCIV